MSEWQLNTPVAFIIFNRPDTTELVFNEIAKAKPPKLLVIADGPRVGKEGEAEKCVATRAIINRVDWDCEVFRNYSEVNLGCKNRVASGLDWVFEQVPEAIILEDDCLPHPTFFRFCEELLEYYRDDERVLMISGTCLSDTEKNNQSYYFSNYPHIWGWASWNRVWKDYDVNMKKLPELLINRPYKDKFKSNKEYKFWKCIFEDVHSGKVNTWDAQVVFLAFSESKLTITPKANLISNIGFRADATHTTKNNPLANLPMLGLTFPLSHPNFMIADLHSEQQRKLKEGIGISYFYKKLYNLISNKIL